MKRTVLFLMIVGLTTTIAFSQKKESRSVSDFTGIEASSVFDITVIKGSTDSLVLEANSDVLEHICSEVQNGVLHLYFDDGKKFRNIKSLKALIVMKDLEMVTLLGACKFTNEDLFTPDKFKCVCSGASSMVLNVNTDQLSIETSGACNIQIKANVTGNTDLNVSGASKIRGELIANNVTFNSSGVCSVELTGSATDIKMDVSGASKIMAEDFIVKTATIKSSGVSKVKVNVSDDLNVNTSGPSSVNYIGSPSLEINNSKISRVKKI